MRKPLILATGFDVFPGAPENPTAWAIGELARTRWQPRDARLETAVLPVTFDMWEGHALPLVRRLRPASVIAFGLSAKTTGVTLESTARNVLATDRPDFVGNLATCPHVEAHGPATRPSALPLAAITSALAQAGVPIVQSDDAGDYLCNMLFYRLLHSVADTGIVQSGFIHVPYLQSQIDRLSAAGHDIAHGGTLDEETLLHGMRTVISTCAAALSMGLTV
jgi:pyroglutamyl-peptidase